MSDVVASRLAIVDLVAQDLRERDAGATWGRLGSGPEAKAAEQQRKKARGRKSRVQGAWANGDGPMGVVG